jgi:hypothetical protein
MSIIDIHTGTTVQPIYTCGDRITREGRTYLLLAVNQEGGWWALNVTENTFESIIPATEDLSGERLDHTTVVSEVVHGINALQVRCLNAERASSSSTRLVERIREYAIERQANGEICRSGLDEFLEHFDLEPVEDSYGFDIVVFARASITAESQDSAVSRLRYLIDGVAYSAQEDNDQLSITMQGIDIN